MDKRGEPSDRTKRYQRRCRVKSANSSEQESSRKQSRRAKAGKNQANKKRKVARVAPIPRATPAAPERSDDDLERNPPEPHHNRCTGWEFQLGLAVIFVLFITFASMYKQPQMALIALQNTTRGEQEKPSAVSLQQDNHENATYVSPRLSCSFVNDAKPLNESIYQEPKPIWKVTTDLVFKIARFVTDGQPGKRVKLKYRPTNGSIIKVTNGNGSSVIKYKCIGCDLSFVLNHTYSY